MFSFFYGTFEFEFEVDFFRPHCSHGSSSPPRERFRKGARIHTQPLGECARLPTSCFSLLLLSYPLSFLLFGSIARVRRVPATPRSLPDSPPNHASLDRFSCRIPSSRHAFLSFPPPDPTFWNLHCMSCFIRPNIPRCESFPPLPGISPDRLVTDNLRGLARCELVAVI